ncbi:MAG: hypothetical protein EOP92_41310 [Lysobacteraceae bacterium]|nr:MAG: hypothetical protein EOP92_41310 [Xanthomonadaceae bacterium]
MPRIAIATAIVAAGMDDDLVPLRAACIAAGIDASVLAWDDATVGWARFDAVLVRSTWDYTERLGEFLHWCARVEAVTELLNPHALLRWNTDKHYLNDLAAMGLPTVPGVFVEPDADPLPALQSFLARFPDPEYVVKPAISAGARDTQRYARHQEFAAGNHMARLLDAGRSVMLQPYLDKVDTQGESGLVYIGGQFSHAIRKSPRLLPGNEAGSEATAVETITCAVPAADELALAEATMAAIARHPDLGHAPPIYARVDLIRDARGAPCVLELELVEPSLFLPGAPGSPDRLAAALLARLAPWGDQLAPPVHDR